MWINVKKNLPSAGVYCLTHSDEISGNKYRILETQRGKFPSAVTHWVPLPPPPNSNAKESPATGVEQLKAEIPQWVEVEKKVVEFFQGESCGREINAARVAYNFIVEQLSAV